MLFPSSSMDFIQVWLQNLLPREAFSGPVLNFFTSLSLSLAYSFFSPDIILYCLFYVYCLAIILECKPQEGRNVSYTSSQKNAWDSSSIDIFWINKDVWFCRISWYHSTQYIYNIEENRYVEIIINYSFLCCLIFNFRVSKNSAICFMNKDEG